MPARESSAESGAGGSANTQPRKAQTVSPAPSSPHDAVVTKLLKRPQAPPRSASLPSPEYDHVYAERSASDTEELDDSRPITALLDGPLEAGGGRVTRALAAQIDAVLRAQEEIGRAHLALENVGACGDPKSALEPHNFDDLEKRAASVSDIMDKLSELSTSLKSYHAIGTPVLSFPRRMNSLGSPISPRSPQIHIANPGVAGPRSDSLMTEMLSSRGVSGVSSPMVLSPANMTPTGSGPAPTPVGGTSLMGSMNAVVGPQSGPFAPAPSSTISKSPTSSNTKRPNIWIQRAGLVPDHDPSLTMSPSEMTPANSKSRPAW